MNVLVIHGPNLNMLGTREPDVYGTTTLDEIDERVRAEGERLGFIVECRRSASEGEIIGWLHDAAGAMGVIVNPGAYSHTSRAIADAIRSISVPVVEVHLSNIHAREDWRRTSVTAEAARGVVSGFGAHSYILGLHALRALTAGDDDTTEQEAT